MDDVCVCPRTAGEKSLDYCQRLAAQGHTCTGIDFSPASIEYARREAERLILTEEEAQQVIVRAS